MKLVFEACGRALLGRPFEVVKGPCFAYPWHLVIFLQVKAKPMLLYALEVFPEATAAALPDAAEEPRDNYDEDELQQELDGMLERSLQDHEAARFSCTVRSAAGVGTAS